ncbi:hypothetical protein GGR25_003015 [Kaistia hirudinis]|uniref:Uncharacterized protein n=1 Tax=Kaistia hirudinis TaxID=1293440 RepID=A0A840ASE1_9HYPH|nr:hypothetical protein [Kaistia hirudinis]
MHRLQARREGASPSARGAIHVSFCSEHDPKKNNPTTRMHSGSVNHA